MNFKMDQPSLEQLRAIVGERTSPVLAWTGAGMSAAADLPTWPTLRNRLLHSARRTAQTLREPTRTERLATLAEIAREENYWKAFGQLRAVMGEGSWNASVTQELTTHPKAGVPACYQLLWRIPELRGIINLNLDGLATRAFSLTNPGARVSEFTGRHAVRLLNLPNGRNRFVVNLHGIVEDAASWILTDDQLTRLSRVAAYKEFLRICLGSWVNVFFGMSADDFAIARHLEYLTKRNLQTSQRFWVTDRTDGETDNWANSMGIQPIRYEAPDGSHAAVDDILRSLLEYRPQEREEYAPIVPDVAQGDGSLLPPDELNGRPAEEIRRILNAEASRLLSIPGEKGREAYKQFTQEYDEQIHAAWFLSTKPGKNLLLGHQLDQEAASGAFGVVYRATSPEGMPEAIKVLHSNIRDHREKLHAFRRGVRSMEILQARRVEGMVAYNDAFEIPAFVSMEWIEGVNLAEAMEAQQIKDWDTVLRIAEELTAIIKKAHALPERVLHRDIRPPNVMLEHFYDTRQDWRVVVLDFDLSWHQGGGDQSVLYSASGYLAPEQITQVPNVTTRSGLVDSFGLGMTLYFLCTGQDPYPGQHTGEQWRTDVRRATSEVPMPGWLSLPRRVERCILGATADQQASRIDVAAIHAELSRSRHAYLNPSEVTDTELLAEEVAARSETMRNYTWNSDSGNATYDSPTGVVYYLGSDESNGRILVNISLVSRGQHDRSKLTKYLVEKAPAAVAALKKGNWNKVQERHAGGLFEISGHADSATASENLDRLAESLDTVGDLLLGA
ncbi:protein kinase domain-containing protein [Streptomyces wedmorensis]|uniref:protein kinase domain-containing protein n=1 Tax=Streptomyces wedmorensis TaxID=43759 RepID=UPI00378AEA86